MKTLKDLLNKKNFGVAAADEKTVEGALFGILGIESENISRSDIKEVRLKEKKLLIKTIHPAVASEIWRMREKIEKLINEKLGEGTIDTIKVR